MKELSLEQLKKYFETVIDLESQILVGQQAIEVIEKKKNSALYDQKRATPTLKSIDRPQKKDFEDFHGEEIDGTTYIERPKVSSMNTKSTILVAFVELLVFSGIGCGIAFIIANIFEISFASCFIWAIAISAALALLTAIVFVVDNVQSSKKIDKWYSENQEYEKKYEKEKAKRLKAIDEEYKREMELYFRRVKEAEAEYNKGTETNKQLTNSIEHAASAEIKRINDAILATKVALNKVYDKDILYPKYRNFIAVCSLYEYLSSGRCSCLEGHEGAYNLYESELRQDLILVKLDIVISQLEDIKKNQYTLYQKMCEIKSAVSSISYQMGQLLKKTDTLIDNTDKIANNTARIAENTRVTALCTQMIAKNTEAIKYINLIN